MREKLGQTSFSHPAVRIIIECNDNERLVISGGVHIQ
jgi:hypothetical protein